MIQSGRRDSHDANTGKQQDRGAPSHRIGELNMARIEMAGAEMAAGSVAGTTGEQLFELGLAYSTGRNVEPDLVAAHKWFNLAAMRGDREAARYRQEIAQEMTHEDVADAQRAAREWLRSQH